MCILQSESIEVSISVLGSFKIVLALRNCRIYPKFRRAIQNIPINNGTKL